MMLSQQCMQDEYSKFISDHGGSTNAYTAAESTNYHFSVKCVTTSHHHLRWQHYVCGCLQPERTQHLRTAMCLSSLNAAVSGL
jgi:hypothetical protein